ncbi:transglutaminase-like domain-containing protein [Aquimarina mytili]|uniref:Transglutaminase-like domain-containing protein n=1 Tax=Aquimarina mytili TaxID=874423 RepID=A0A936ZQ02_9FLAO|nr:transglutaminase-like domain-containing protein [Aquimarina mytili]MBL0683594.1 hypothetical protein [Aquimarina mytili]
MQAQAKRHIGPGDQFSHLIPKSISRDTIVVGSGKAQLKDTLNLMKQIIKETKGDTVKLASKLKGHNVVETCMNIWQFVYDHIQYTMDKTGIEQVRRPSRTWADRKNGVDCDCYTVFIGSILSNLDIPFKMRITKYGGKQHFQHVYPIVPIQGGHITIDCVTDKFNHEVPYSEKKDISINGTAEIKDISGLSGVDMADISLDAIVQQRIPLLEIIPGTTIMQCSLPKPIHIKPKSKAIKSGTILSPFRFEDSPNTETMGIKKDLNLLNYLIISVISVSAGIGVLKLLTKKAQGAKQLKNKSGQRPK